MPPSEECHKYNSTGVFTYAEAYNESHPFSRSNTRAAKNTEVVKYLLGIGNPSAIVVALGQYIIDSWAVSRPSGRLHTAKLYPPMVDSVVRARA